MYTKVINNIYRYIRYLYLFSRISYHTSVIQSMVPLLIPLLHYHRWNQSIVRERPYIYLRPTYPSLHVYPVKPPPCLGYPSPRSDVSTVDHVVVPKLCTDSSVNYPS